MKVEYLYKMDQIARDAGTREPEDVLASKGCIFMDPCFSVDGFVTRRKGLTYYGVSRRFTGKKYDFGVMHEGFHIICRHIDLPGFLTGSFPAHTDSCGAFSTYKQVASTERDADIGAADFICDTQTILEMMGYDSADVAQYRRDIAAFEAHVREYKKHLDLVIANGSPASRVNRMQTYRQKLAKMFEELQAQAQDISSSGICLTKARMAGEFGVPEYIIDYKLEALSLRSYDVGTVELPSFDKVFREWK